MELVRPVPQSLELVPTRSALTSARLRRHLTVEQVAKRSGLTPDQVDTVRGYADRRPRIADDPLDARNRRISIIVHNS